MADLDIPNADRDWYSAEAVAWESLRRQLSEVHTFAAAEKVVFTGPGSGRPGHRFYANLGHFLARGFAVPPASSPDERALYAVLVGRLERGGEIPVDRAARIVRSLEPRRPRNL